MANMGTVSPQFDPGVLGRRGEGRPGTRCVSDSRWTQAEGDAARRNRGRTADSMFIRGLLWSRGCRFGVEEGAGDRGQKKRPSYSFSDSTVVHQAEGVYGYFLRNEGAEPTISPLHT